MADYRRLVQKQVNQAITKKLGKLEETATYVSLSASYNVATSEGSGVPTEKIVKAVFYDNSEELALGSRLAARNADDMIDTVESTLPKLFAIVPSLQLPGVTPKVNDVIRRADDSEHTIESFKVDTAIAAYVFSLRRP